MPRGLKLETETVDQIKKAKADGLTHKDIVAKFLVDGKPISLRTVAHYSRGIHAEHNKDIEKLITAVNLPTPAGSRMSKKAVQAESMAQTAIALETVAELEDRARLRKRREEGELREAEIDLRQRSLELSIQEANFFHPPTDEAQSQVQSQIQGFKLALDNLQAEKAKAEKERDKLDTEIRQSQFEQRIQAMLSANQGNQWGFYTKALGEAKELALDMGIHLDKMTDKFATGQLKLPHLPHTGAVTPLTPQQISRHLDLKSRFLNFESLSTTEMLEVKGLLRSEAGLPPIAQTTTEKIMAVCPGCQTHNPLDIAALRSRVQTLPPGQTQEFTLTCLKCGIPFPINHLLGQTATPPKPTAAPPIIVFE